MTRRKPKHAISLFKFTVGGTADPLIIEPIKGRLGVYANLAPDMWDRINQSVPGELTDEQGAVIARAILAYIISRWDDINQIPYKPVSKPNKFHDVGSYFEALEDVDKALELLASSTRIGVRSVVWDDMCKVNPVINLSEMEKILSDLHRRANILKDKYKRLAETTLDKPSNFSEFVLCLADLFHSAGWKVAAAKSSRAKDPKPSDFVRFVHAIMISLHPSVREHSQSEAAMAKAISPIITRSRSSRTLRDGKRSNSPRKSPATSR